MTFLQLTRDNELGGRENADDLLLPPDLKETIFQDLNNELLEGISMQVSQSNSIFCLEILLKWFNTKILSLHNIKLLILLLMIG